MGTVEAAQGKWLGLLTHFGIDSKYLIKRHGPCPMCGGKDRFTWDNKHNLGTFLCNHCGAGTGFTLLCKFKGWTMAEAMKHVEKIVGGIDRKMSDHKEPSDQQRREAMNKTWTGAQAVQDGDPVSSYLKARTGRHWASNAIRYHAQLWHPEEKRSLAGMVAKVTDPDNRPVSIHRTYLEPDGSKAKVAKGKMVMSSTIPDGSAIRLMPYTETLGVTEGIETAFSASAIFDVPVWATISASIMVKWKPPASIRHVIIFGDNDQNFVGQLSAYRLAYTLAREHPKEFAITVCIPAIGGADWNDVLALNGLDTARKDAYIAHPRAFRVAPA